MLGKGILFVCVVCFVSPARSSILRKVFPNDDNRAPFFAKSKYENGGTSMNEVRDYRVCDTEACRIVAQEFANAMNKAIDPCENFYEFTCGGWSNHNPVPPSMAIWSRFVLFQKTAHHRIKEILETDPEPSDILPVRQAKKWYRSCMETETLEELGIKPIDSILLRAGGWPMAMDEEEWDEDQNWQDIELYYTRLTGAYTFYDIVVGERQNLGDPISPLMISPQQIPLGDQMPLQYRNYGGNDYDTYFAFVFDVASYFIQHNRANVPNERLIKETKELVEFEKLLFQIQQYSDEAYIRLKDFYGWYGGAVPDPNERIDVKKILDSLFAMINTEVDPNTTFYLKSQIFVENIGKVLARTPKRTIVNYIHWNFIANMLPSTTETARNRLNRLFMTQFGVKEREPRWAECVDGMKMAHAAGYAFVQKYSSKETEKEVSEMAENIRGVLEDQIRTADWIDENSRKLVLGKLDAMKVFIGFPDWYRNKHAVVKSYKGLNIGYEYFDNVLSYKKYERKKKLKTYRHPSMDVWQMDPITINAAYTPLLNSLIVPAADFQAPLLTSHFPAAVNYGILGILLGHEIGHGFDNDGIKYGKDGRPTKLSKMMLKDFLQRASCFIDQYDKLFNETDIAKSSKNRAEKSSVRTTGENIADATGIQSVYRAYERVKKSEGSMRLPGGLEEYTDDQLFYISFGAMWCEIGTPEFEIRRDYSLDEHSPSRVRVNGAVANAQGFAEAFNCPVGSPMNPANKCSLWEKTNRNEHKNTMKHREVSNHPSWQWNI